MNKIVYVGAVELSQVGLDELLRQGAKPELVVTLRPDFDARHSDFADLAKLADAHDIPVHFVDNINEPALMERLADLKPDYVFVIGWSQDYCWSPATCVLRSGRQFWAQTLELSA